MTSIHDTDMKRIAELQKKNENLYTANVELRKVIERLQKRISELEALISSLPEL